MNHPLVPILSHIKPVHVLSSYLFYFPLRGLFHSSVNNSHIYVVDGSLIRNWNEFGNKSWPITTALFRVLPGGTDKNHEKSVRIPSVPAEIRTEHLPNMGLERYRYVNPLDPSGLYIYITAGIVQSVQRADYGLEFRQDLEIFLHSTSPRPSLGPTQAPTQWVPGALSPTVKRLAREADHSPPSSAEIRMVELYLHSPIRLRGMVLN
jgi:hypothetical protein